jgi:hypothetical protein
MQNPISQKPAKREIWTYQPPKDIKALISSIIGSKVGRKLLKLKPNAARGMRTLLLNEALRAYFGKKKAANV